MRILITILLSSAICFAQPTNPGATLRANTFTDTQTISKSASNYSPGTTAHIITQNTGTNTYQSNYFSGVLKSATGYSSSGEHNFYANGGNYFAFYSGLGSPSLFAYLYPNAFVHSSGYGAFASGVSAGSSTSPTSTLANQGTLENKTILVTASQTLSTSATNILCDGTTAAACTGTPSNACSSYTGSGQAACEARNSHGGCSWNPGTSCSVYNNESGMSNCLSTSGCTADTSACTGYDESSCLSGDDSYGGSCAWTNDPQSCSGFDESTCSMTSGCTVNYFDCSSLTNDMDCSGHTGCTSNFSSCIDFTGNQAACEATSGCSWSDPDCTGSYFTSCSGSPYDGCTGSYDNYICTGTYYTGNCSGYYGTACSGTPTCSGITGSTDCGNETGCSWSSVLNLTLPNTPPNGREYRIKNVATGGADCVVLPYSGYDIDGSSSLTLAAYKDSTMLVYFQLTADCSVYNGNQSTCNSTSGCTPNYSNCSWDSMNSVCNGGGSCSSYTDEFNCNAATYFSSCSGTYSVAKRWHEMAKRY